MAKLSLIRLDEPLADGTFRVYVRIAHKHSKAKKRTEFTCTEKDTDQNKVVTSFRLVSKIYSAFLEDWEKKLALLEEDNSLDSMSALEILNYLENKKSRNAPDITRIDFLSFARQYEQQALKDGRRKSSIAYRTVIYSLIDFHKKDSLFVDELTTNFVNSFVDYLKSEHTYTRMNHGKSCKVKKNGLNNQSVNNRIKDFKTLFNAMKKKYCDPLTGEEYIRTNPFKFWKPLIISTNGGYRATDVGTIRSLNELNELSELERFGRDMFILSFCLLGINATDLYDLKVNDYKDGRINYCRNKTKGRRTDEAFISVEVLPPAEKILKQYLPKKPLSLLNLSEKYSGVDNLSRAINKGLKSLYLRNIGIPKLTYYSARHTWATIARNECGISREDIDAALNHASEDLKMADKYIKKDFSVNDRNNRKVLEYVFGKEENCKKCK